jgi:tetratricopeptide (TPR) repeat protein
MSREEGAALLLRRAKHLRVLPTQDRHPILVQATPADRALATDLVTALDGLPLALDQAGAYLEETGCSIADYLQRYAQNRVPLLARRGAAAGAHPTSVAATLLLAVEQVQQVHRAAKDLLWLCSFLHSEAIPEELLSIGAPHLGPVLSPVVSDSLEFDLLLAALRRFSLVTRYPETHTLALHRLVQMVLRDQMDPATTRLWSERAIRAVNAAFPPVEFATWAQAERCLPHALACLALLERRGNAPPETIELLYKTGSYLLARGRYREAESLLVQAVTLAEAQYGAEQAAMVPLLVQLGMLRRHQARYDQAAALLHRALSLGEQHLGPNHPQIAKTLGELAELYWLQGNYTLAAQFGQRALALVEQQRGPEHPETAAALNSLATFRNEQGRYAEAEVLCRRALDIFERQLGPTHPQTAETLDNLAHVALDRGNVEQAAPIFQQVLTLREQLLGPEHPLTARSLNNLALAYYKQAHYNKALTMLLRALEISEQQLGPDHPETALCLHNLATVYRVQERFAEALPLYTRALAVDERLLGPNHPMLAFPLNQLALLYCATEEYEQAEVNGERALRLRRTQLGADHPLTAISLATLATIYRAQGKEAEALMLSQQALAIYERSLGPDHPSTLQVRKDADGGEHATCSPSVCSVLDSSERVEQVRSVLNSSEHQEQVRSVLDSDANRCTEPAPTQESSLVTAFAGVPDRRSAQGQRHPLPAVLMLLTAALLSDAKTLRGVARWGRSQPPEVVQSLGFKGASTPALSTLHTALKSLEKEAFEQVLETWIQQVLGNEREVFINQNWLVESFHKSTLPGARVIEGYPYEMKQMLRHRGLNCPDS